MISTSVNNFFCRMWMWMFFLETVPNWTRKRYIWILKSNTNWESHIFLQVLLGQILFYLRIFLSPLCQRGSPCKSTLATACPCCSTRQLSDRTVFQWILKAIVATRDFKSQRHKVLDKQGRCIAAGGKCAMKSLGNHVVHVPVHCCGNELRWPRQRANIR